MLIKNIINCCDTGLAYGLNEQILNQLVSQNSLVKVNHPLIKCSGRQNNPYLQHTAYKALKKVVEGINSTITINSCLRTPIQQHILRQQYQKGWCGITAAARPGTSNHESGMAIDISNPHSWKAHLETYGWQWRGSWDKWHFDFIDRNYINLSAQQILVFQKLWNQYNDDQIIEDGIWGRQTARAVERSPVDGFGVKETLRKGMISNQVHRLQYLIKQRLGTDGEFLVVDGKYGKATVKAVMLYQEKMGLIADGIAGDKTLTALEY